MPSFDCTMQLQSEVFEETPFFSSSMQDFNSVQQVLHVPSLTPLVSPVHEIPSMDTSQATYPISTTRSPPSVDQHESQIAI